MDLGPMLVLGAAWLVLNALRKAGAGTTQTKPPPAPRRPLPDGRPAGANPSGRRAARARPDAPRTRVAVALDPTQREGARLEQLLRQLGRTLEEAAGVRGAGRRIGPCRRPRSRRRAPNRSRWLPKCKASRPTPHARHASWWTRTTRPNRSSRAGCRRPKRTARRVPGPIIGPSTSASGRRPPTRPRSWRAGPDGYSRA